ncbi:MAG: multisubstrate pseudouridine synthase 7 [Marteilia pararefringens]
MVSSLQIDDNCRTGVRFLNRDIWQLKELRDVKSFVAKYKTYYEDFKVEEIDVNDNVVECGEETDVMPIDPELEAKSKQLEEEKVDVYEFDEDILNGINDIVSKKSKYYEFETSEGKDGRTLIHSTIRKKFDDLESQTLDSEGGKKIIKVTEKGKHHRSVYYKGIWKFVMKKHKVSTQKAINDIAGLLRRNPNSFSCAGNKDSFAITTQNISSYGIQIKDLFRIRNEIPNISLSNFQKQNEVLRIGQLNGNKFTLILRDIQFPRTEIDKIMKFLKTFGFINYFGIQRFGSYTNSTDSIGLTFMIGDYKRCIEYTLQNKMELINDETLISEVLNDIEKLTNLLKTGVKRHSSEYFVLKHLIQNKLDYKGAYLRIPHNERKLHCHAVQSLIWNNMVSNFLENLQKELSEVNDYSEKVKKMESLKDFSIPIIGYQTKSIDEENFSEVLEKLDIDRDLFESSMRNLKLTGSHRKIFAIPEDLEYEFIDDTTICVKFKLKSSMYATEFLRELTGGSIMQGSRT